MGRKNKSVDQELLDKIATGIKNMREEHGISQEIFIHDTGIHIGRIELGMINITITTLKKVCFYFKVPLSTFLSSLDE